MKKLIILITINLSTAVFADTNKYYQFKTMECAGKVNQKPSAMHPGYTYMGLRVIHFTPKRKDGTFTHSLAWNTFYGETHGELVKNMKNKKYGGEVWYTGMLKAKRVQGALAVSRQFDSSMIFTGYVLDQKNRYNEFVKARFSKNGSVVGSYFYKMNCRVFK